MNRGFTNTINFVTLRYDDMINELAAKDKTIQEYMQR